MAYQKIIQVGASGNVGAPVFDALVASGKFEITVLARESSSFTTPHASVKVVKVDFSNKQELVNALKGYDAVALTLGDLPNLLKNSKVIIDAAIEAGVKRIIPSEYGNDLDNSPGRDEIVFTPKLQVNDYLREKGAEGAIEYTVIATGPFFDWGLTHQFLGFDIPNKKATIYSGGNKRINVTTLQTIGASVAAVFSNPAQFKNKFLRISDFYVSQNEILAVLEAETGSKFTIQEIDADANKAKSDAKLAQGEWTQEAIYGALLGALYGSKSSATWGQEDDAESLGLPKKILTEEIKKVL